MNTGISGVILAGGSSRRFRGVTKANIIVEGKPIIERILNATEAFFEEIIIVTNSPKAFKPFSQCIITGDLYRNKGPLGGIHAGMKSSTKDAIFVLAGDMPFPDKELIGLQVDYFRKNRCDILIPRVGRNIEPLHGIYRNSILNRLEAYLAEGREPAVREFIKSMDTKYMPVTESPMALRSFSNINSPSDLKRLEKGD